MQQNHSPQDPARRCFFKKACAITIGTVAAVIPPAAGLALFFDPLRRSPPEGEMLRVTSLEALPIDGIPRKFSIVADRSDAWNRYPQARVGAIYLRRTGETEIQALNVVCPHAGCFIDYHPSRDAFFCPCHNSLFGLDGSLVDRKSPSPRPMDTLEVEIRNEREVWVKFQNFRAGQAEKVPVV
jgi:menaquinol-cytochrome c reductase iron-sulfur subunit